jgi:predicted alpha/beta hydrolase
VTPADAGASRIGHMGFFRPEHRYTLWRGAAEWIDLPPRKWTGLGGF